MNLSEQSGVGVLLNDCICKFVLSSNGYPAHVCTCSIRLLSYSTCFSNSVYVSFKIILLVSIQVYQSVGGVKIGEHQVKNTYHIHKAELDLKR